MTKVSTTLTFATDKNDPNSPIYLLTEDKTKVGFIIKGLGFDEHDVLNERDEIGMWTLYIYSHIVSDNVSDRFVFQASDDHEACKLVSLLLQTQGEFVDPSEKTNNEK